MPFNSESASVKHNAGMSKADLEQGFERLDPYADCKVFGHSKRSPEAQGWDATPIGMGDVEHEGDID